MRRCFGILWKIWCFFTAHVTIQMYMCLYFVNRRFNSPEKKYDRLWVSLLICLFQENTWAITFGDIKMCQFGFWKLIGKKHLGTQSAHPQKYQCNSTFFGIPITRKHWLQCISWQCRIHLEATALQFDSYLANRHDSAKPALRTGKSSSSPDLSVTQGAQSSVKPQESPHLRLLSPATEK